MKFISMTRCCLDWNKKDQLWPVVMTLMPLLTADVTLYEGFEGGAARVEAGEEAGAEAGARLEALVRAMAQGAAHLVDVDVSILARE